MVLSFLSLCLFSGFLGCFSFLPSTPGPKQCAVYTVAPSPTAQVLGGAKALIQPFNKDHCPLVVFEFYLF